MITGNRSFIEANRSAIESLVTAAAPTLEVEAAVALAEQQETILFWSVEEADNGDWLSDRLARGGECGYRRGYLDGYSRAMDDLQRGCSKSRWEKVACWFNDFLTPWRYGEPKLLEEPPRYPAAQHHRVPAA